MQMSSLRIFIDFDGTITDCDVGDSIFERFLHPDLLERGWHREIIEDWKAGRISSSECLVRECENTVVSREALNQLLDGHTLTPGFGCLVEFCRREGIPLTILSDGLDYYIEFILAKYGLSEVPFHANHMFFSGTALGVDFPYVDRGCGRCANCKRWHIDSGRRDGDTVVYIGDGYSDRYAIRSVDRVFARRDLAEYCDRNKVSYTPFENFYEVMDYLENGNGKG